MKRSLSGLRCLAFLATTLPTILLSAGQGLAAADGGDEPATLSGTYLSALSALAQRDFNGASEFLGEALQLDPANPDLVQRTFAERIAIGDMAGAFDLAKVIVATRPSDQMAQTALGVLAMKNGQFDEAKARFDAASVGPIGKLVSAVLGGWAQDGLGKPDAAIATIDAVTGPDWYSVFKSYHHSLLADIAGRPDEAVRQMKIAYDPQGSTLRMAEAYASVLARAGNSAAAQKVLLDFIAKNRSHPLLEAVLKDINSGKKPDAVVQTAAQGAAELLYQIGVAVNTAGTEDIAASYLNLAVYLNPTSDLVLLALGDVWQSAHNHDAAVAAYGAIPPGSVLSHLATVSMALSLDALDRTDEGAAKLKALLADNPKDTEAATALGDIYRGRQRFAEAADAYDMAVASSDSLGRNDWRVLFSRGISYERTQRWPQAEADFKKALELSPDQAQVLNYLGYSWIEQNAHIDEAMAMIKKAVDQRPDDGYIVDSLGWAYYHLGQYAQAATYLQRAILLMPEDPTINDHLGDAFWQVGRKLEATFQWSHARDFHPEPDDLAKIVKKLESGLPPPSAGKNG